MVESIKEAIDAIFEIPNDIIVGLLSWAKQKAKTEKEAEVRAERDRLLAKADIAVNKAADSRDSFAEMRAREWRQALRDVPQQTGFPHDVEWPHL